MSVIWFEGWDIHRMSGTSTAVPIGVWDYQGFPGWSHPTVGFSLPQFVPGFEGGQAMRIRAIGGYITSTSISPTPQRRVGFWARRETNPVISGDRVLLMVQQSTSALIGLRVEVGGQLSLATASSTTDFSGSNIGGGQGVFSEDWSHYELFLDATADRVELYQDGQLVAAQNDALLSSANFGQIRLRAPGEFPSDSPIEWDIDHIYVTDGSPIMGIAGYHSVAVIRTEAAGGDEGAGAGARTRARLIIDGVNYDSSETQPQTQIGPLSDHPSRMNVRYSYFNENPATEAPWGGDILSVIDSWGVCRTDASGGRIYFSDMMLGYLQTVNGFPQARYVAPNDIVSLTGDWIRTDPSLTLFAHLSEIPRTFPIWENAATQDDQDPFDLNSEGFLAKYTAVLTPGCIQFLATDVTPPFAGVGLTFAEEFRDTYRDWEIFQTGGENFESYFITGYRVHGEGDKKFQSNYVTVNYEPTQLGSAFLQGVWDYAVSGDSGRWGTTQQVYGPGNDPSLYRHATRKLKVRGHGKALQFKVKSETGRPFFINGWTVYVTGNPQP